MTAAIRTITVDCADWVPLVAFWTQALGWSDDPDNPNSPGDPEGLIASADGASRLLFLPVPEAKQVKNRMHLDLTPTDCTRDEQVAALLAIGATQVADFRQPDGSGFVVLADPEGNEFCVERSERERKVERSEHGRDLEQS